MNAQAVTSETKFDDGSHESGPAYQAFLERSSRAWNSTPCIRTFQPALTRNLVSSIAQTSPLQQLYWPDVSTQRANTLRPMALHIFQLSLWDHNGTRLTHQLNPQYEWDFPRNSAFVIFNLWEHEQLRPQDFSTLTTNRDYTHVIGGAQLNTQYFKWINLSMEMDWGTATNFVPRTGPPVLAYQNTGFVKATVRPTKGLTIENTYLMTRLLDQNTNLNIFNNHIMRSKWNYQFTKEFSLRLIGEYVTTISNPVFDHAAKHQGL